MSVFSTTCTPCCMCGQRPRTLNTRNTALEPILVRNLDSLTTLNHPATSPSPAMCLALPWEVIERVIDHSAGHTRTLRSFALTCRDLNPRSAIHLFRHLKFKKRDQIFALCDVLRAKPHLQQCVESVSVHIDEYSPHPLLRMLPHLSEIKINESWLESGSFLPSPILRSCHQFGQHIQSLSLTNITFRSLSDFAAILLSFPRIHTLSCYEVRAKQDVTHQPEGVDWEAPGSITRRLSQRLHLRTLDVSPYYPRHPHLYLHY